MGDLFWDENSDKYDGASALEELGEPRKTILDLFDIDI